MAWNFPWGIYTTALRTLTNNQKAPPSLDVNGNLKISEGTKITAENLGSGGGGLIGWLSEIAKRIANQSVYSTTTPQAKSVSFDTGFVSKTTAPTAYAWQVVQQWTVPGIDTSYIFIPAIFYFISQGTVYGRLVEKALLATSQNGTPFTDGIISEDVERENWTYIEVVIITPVNTNCTFTVTYTNEHNVTGRTATAAVTTTMAAGTRLRLTLQGTDYGVVDITNITQSVGITSGKIEVHGIKIFALLASADTNQTHIDQAPVSLNGAAMRGTRTMAIEYASPNVSTSRTMIGGLIGNLQNEL